VLQKVHSFLRMSLMRALIVFAIAAEISPLEGNTKCAATLSEVYKAAMKEVLRNNPKVKLSDTAIETFGRFLQRAQIQIDAAFTKPGLLLLLTDEVYRQKVNLPGFHLNFFGQPWRETGNPLKTSNTELEKTARFWKPTLRTLALILVY